MDRVRNVWYGGRDGSHTHYDHTRYYALNLHAVFSKGTLEWRCFESTLHAGKVRANITLALAISAQAINQRSTQMKKTLISENPAFTFRTFLLRLGLIGDEYKNVRKYDYGVDSLIMAQMASKIRNNYTKNEIPFDVLLRQLLNHPDVLSLYQYIENYSMPDKKLVQNIKNDGIGTINIFHENKNDTLQVLLHAGFGTMNCFRYLIEYMRLDNKGTIAGIAIKNSKRYCEMNPDNLIEILADEYVNLIIGLNKKKIQIIGYCISGLIAVEIARRLMERGLEIFDLVLIDSHPIQYQLEDELLMEITFLPSLGIEISQLGLGEISNEELYKAVLYLYNEFKKEIPSRSIQYLPDEYINLKKILLKLDCMEKRQRFELYSKMALEKAENQFPVDMCIDLFAAYKQSFKAAQFVPEVYAGNIRFLLAEESTSFIPDNDEETLAFWKNTCLDDMSVEMIKGNHITCTENKENACTLCKKISKCFQD